MRSYYLKCVEHATIQNVYSPMWFVESVSTDSGTKVTLLNYLKTDQHATSVVIETQGNEYTFLLHQEADDLFSFVTDIDIIAPRIKSVSYGELLITVDKFLAYMPEGDMLSPKATEYFMDTYPGFGVFPSISSNTWQCLCSCVNPKNTDTCLHCNRTRSENEMISTQDYRMDVMRYMVNSIMQTGEVIGKDKISDIASETQVPRSTIVSYIDSLKSEDIKSEKIKSDRVLQSKKPHVRKHLSKKQTVLVVLGVAILMGFVIVTPKIKPSLDYNKAISLRDSGDFDGAISIFESLGDYNDAKVQIQETKYRKAEKLFESGDYQGAINTYDLITSYNGAAARREHAIYAWADSLEKSKDYEAALVQYLRIQSFQDVKQRVSTVYSVLAQQSYDAHKYKEAYDYAKQSDLKESNALIYNILREYIREAKSDIYGTEDYTDTLRNQSLELYSYNKSEGNQAVYELWYKVLEVAYNHIDYQDELDALMSVNYPGTAQLKEDKLKLSVFMQLQTSDPVPDLSQYTVKVYFDDPDVGINVYMTNGDVDKQNFVDITIWNNGVVIERKTVELNYHDGILVELISPLNIGTLDVEVMESGTTNTLILRNFNVVSR